MSLERRILLMAFLARGHGRDRSSGHPHACFVAICLALLALSSGRLETSPQAGSPSSAGPGLVDPPGPPAQPPQGNGNQTPSSTASTSPSTPGPLRPPSAPAIKYGLDAASLELQQRLGFTPDYATIWIGPWNLEKGWREPDGLLRQLHANNVTPAIHFYYWAEDLSPRCLEEGCNGKSREKWAVLAGQLAAHLDTQMQGAPAIIVLESEFNKASVARYAPFDGYLAKIATGLHAAYPSAHVVLGFGNWNADAWSTWKLAAAASNSTGLQALSAAPRDSISRQLALYNETLAGVARLRSLFGKPVFLVDVAASSFPEPDNLDTQREALAGFLGGNEQLANLGVAGVLYRSLTDSPGMGLHNFYGIGERHWGVAWTNGTLKPSGDALVEARGDLASDSTPKASDVAPHVAVGPGRSRTTPLESRGESRGQGSS